MLEKKPFAMTASVRVNPEIGSSHHVIKVERLVQAESLDDASDILRTDIFNEWYDGRTVDGHKATISAEIESITGKSAM